MSAYLLQADLIKCFSTLTGLSKLAISHARPPTSFWMKFTVMHTSSRGMKRFLLYICGTRQKWNRHFYIHGGWLYIVPRDLWDMLEQEGEGTGVTLTQKQEWLWFQVILRLEVSVNLLQMLLFVQFKEHPVQTFNTKTITSTSQLTCLCYSSTIQGFHEKFGFNLKGWAGISLLKYIKCNWHLKIA